MPRNRHLAMLRRRPETSRRFRLWSFHCRYRSLVRRPGARRLPEPYHDDSRAVRRDSQTTRGRRRRSSQRVSDTTTSRRNSRASRIRRPSRTSCGAEPPTRSRRSPQPESTRTRWTAAEMTAAMVAIHLNRPDVLKELLDAGANPDLESYSWIYRDTRRPLTVATYLGNRAAVAMLLDAGADLNQVYYDTAVHVAARHARTEIVRELLERGAESIRTATNRHPAARNHRGTHRRLRCARPHRKSAGGCGRGTSTRSRKRETTPSASSPRFTTQRSGPSSESPSTGKREGLASIAMKPDRAAGGGADGCGGLRVAGESRYTLES